MLAISLTIACSRYIYNGVILHAHPVRGESHNQRNTTGEVATVQVLDRILRLHASRRQCELLHFGDIPKENTFHITSPKNGDRRNVHHRNGGAELSHSGESCHWLFICNFFRAGFKLVSLSRMAFPRVLFMSRRLWFIFRMCSTWLKPCSAAYVMGTRSSSNNSVTLPQTSGKPSLHLIQKSDHPY